MTGLIGLDGKAIQRVMNMFPSFIEFKHLDGRKLILHFKGDGTCHAGEGSTLQDILEVIASLPADPAGLLTMWCLAAGIRAQIERDELDATLYEAMHGGASATDA